jgi:hypothetical protein
MVSYRVKQLQKEATDAVARAVKAEGQLEVLKPRLEKMESTRLNNPTPDAYWPALEVRQLALRCAHSYSSPAHPWIATDNIAVPRPCST